MNVPSDLTNKPHAQPKWRPFDEHGHQKIGPRWGDTTWRDLAIFLALILGIFVAWLLLGQPHYMRECAEYILC